MLSLPFPQSVPCPTPLLISYPSSDVLHSVLSHFFVPDPEIFPQLGGLKLEADDELIYVFNIDADPTTDDSKHPMVSIFTTDAFIGEEVNPKKKRHQAYTLMGEKKPGVVYKRKYRKQRIGSNLL
jgi:hypothetical protein